jgi:putative hemolysin
MPRPGEEHDVRTSTAAPRAPLDATYPKFLAEIPLQEITGGRYVTRFARDAADLKAIQRLRFEVFNLELHEGLDASFVTGLDQDQYDLACHHLLVTVADTREVVGTYRVQTRAMAEAGAGWYTASEYDLAGLPDWLLDAAVETGRACVAKDHRNGRVLNHLWKGLAAYLAHNRKRYLFGCCSLTSQDPELGRRVMDHLTASGHTHPTIELAPQPDWRCYDESVAAAAGEAEPVELPKLFSLYLRYGAKVLGRPALDRYFKTIDYLVLLDIDDLSPDSREMFFA